MVTNSPPVARHGSVMPSANSNSFACMIELPVDSTGCPSYRIPKHDRRAYLHGWMHKSAASGHESAYLWFLGVKGSLRPPLTPRNQNPYQPLTHSKFKRGNRSFIRHLRFNRAWLEEKP
jgi:hypothetical protein